MDVRFEKNLIVNDRRLTYKGIFRVDELFMQINNALDQKGYTKVEKRTQEFVTEDGRSTFVELRPYKTKTNYAMLVIKMKISLDNITEVVQEHQGVTRKYQKGDILIQFDSWVLTDYNSRWTMKPFVFFMKAMINKFFYKFPLEGAFPGEVAGDTSYIYARIKKLLNSYKFTATKIVQEKDVMAQVASDIKNGN